MSSSLGTGNTGAVSDQDASQRPSCEGVSGVSIWEETPGLTLNTLEGLYISLVTWETHQG